MIDVYLTRSELVLCYENAVKACLGGISRIREGQDRQSKLFEDQLVGQIGNAAGCKWFYGNVEDYKAVRDRANAAPTLGDGGFDLTGLNTDFKCSLMRGKSRNPLDYRLLVRPNERHEDWLYVLLLIEEINYGKMKDGMLVHLVGAASDSELPVQAEESGVFEGAFLKKASDLHAFPEDESLIRSLIKNMASSSTA